MYHLYYDMANVCVCVCASERACVYMYEYVLFLYVCVCVCVCVCLFVSWGMFECISGTVKLLSHSWWFTLPPKQLLDHRNANEYS